MRVIIYLILFSLANCFTIYTKGETILQSEKINTKNVKEEKDVFVLTHSFTNDGLYLLLDGYRVEEDNQIDLIKEKYKENKDFKLNDYTKKIASDNKKDNEPICNGAIVVVCVVVALPVLIAADYVYKSAILLELPTLPIRLMSEPQERIREEIKKGNITKIGIVSTSDIAITFLNQKPIMIYEFREDKVFIPLEELSLEKGKTKNINFEVLSLKTRKILLTGNINLAEDINSNPALTK